MTALDATEEARLRFVACTRLFCPEIGIRVLAFRAALLHHRQSFYLFAYNLNIVFELYFLNNRSRFRFLVRVSATAARYNAFLVHELGHHDRLAFGTELHTRLPEAGVI